MKEMIYDLLFLLLLLDLLLRLLFLLLLLDLLLRLLFLLLLLDLLLRLLFTDLRRLLGKILLEGFLLLALHLLFISCLLKDEANLGVEELILLLGLQYG